MTPLGNMPQVKLALVGVSRDCFPIELTRRRMAAVAKALEADAVPHHACTVVIENENHAMAALHEIREAGCDAAVVYLGNFGPETPETLFAQRFMETTRGPVMAIAAAEEDRAVMSSDRGDALCGLLNFSYNMGLRRLRCYIPERPVRTPVEAAKEIAGFVDIARVVVGVRGLKIFGFGPRPQDFLACNAPVQGFYDLGVEIMENSELDLLARFNEAAAKKSEIAHIVEEMKREVGADAFPDLLPKLAQFEVALTDFMGANLGASRFAAFADKCWPAFSGFFGFVPCYVNSRMSKKGVPVACEVDYYGALSQYMAQCATMRPGTLLDINNSVPDELVPANADLRGAAKEDLFMGFHCGNTCSECLEGCALKYQLIMHRTEPEGVFNTKGTIEGRLKRGPTTFFRLQGRAAGGLSSYIAEGEILPLETATFGGTGIFAIPGFARFYRHALVAGHYPHHGAVGFAKKGQVLYEAVRLLGVDAIQTPLPAHLPYATENPFVFAKR